MVPSKEVSSVEWGQIEVAQRVVEQMAVWRVEAEWVASAVVVA